MTACFTNKKSKGKLKRYYYYRCTSTLSRDWQSCPVKQVSAERLENFCIENLERISFDKNYIENLVFRLNSDFQARHGVGYELTEECSKFSAQTLFEVLKFFVSELKKSKGIERNLLAKKFSPKIFYSPETIKLRLILPQSGGEAAVNASPAQLAAGRGERTIPFEKSEFVMCSIAPNLENPQTFEIVLPNLIHKCKKRNLN
jgi:hypothetical protein